MFALYTLVLTFFGQRVTCMRVEKSVRRGCQLSNNSFRYNRAKSPYPCEKTPNANASSVDILIAHLALNAAARLSSCAHAECDDLPDRQAELV